MNDKEIKIAILDSVPKSHWSDDGGITDGQKFIDLLEPENINAKFDIFYVSLSSRLCYDLTHRFTRWVTIWREKILQEIRAAKDVVSIL